MNKIELNFGGEQFTAKFGIGFIGAYLKSSGTSINELFTEFQSNPFFVAPNLIYHAIIKGGGDITLEKVEDMIDADGGINSPELLKFINAFAESLTVNLPEEAGKPKRAKPKS